jgi:hypothetical protein
METKRMGLIESIDDKTKTVKILGYGNYLGDFPKMDDFIGIEVNTPKIKLDNGTIVWGTDSAFFGETETVEQLIADYKNRGFLVK